MLTRHTIEGIIIEQGYHVRFIDGYGGRAISVHVYLVQWRLPYRSLGKLEEVKQMDEQALKVLLAEKFQKVGSKN